MIPELQRMRQEDHISRLAWATSQDLVSEKKIKKIGVETKKMAQ